MARSRTRDGGRSVDVLGNGLPHHHSHDLAWRHALGSTSGGLWISEGGGECWTMPEARLPPIAAVRFVQT
jgi:hypothetical protein